MAAVGRAPPMPPSMGNGCRCRQRHASAAPVSWWCASSRRCSLKRRHRMQCGMKREDARAVAGAARGTCTCPRRWTRGVDDVAWRLAVAVRAHPSTLNTGLQLPAITSDRFVMACRDAAHCTVNCRIGSVIPACFRIFTVHPRAATSAEGMVIASAKRPLYSKLPDEAGVECS